uniref:AB hydrolase-1 domain-containing protein n=1 Tax=Odontella aurita TaxID=265563 RepID=A0A7S4HRM0_9STRA|mmetsp:Transcript_13989/g.40974  ORF Transcript_13989/g.40974 Transcript_13989/m.40974 type:complete len:726 (+) Transcript_13989:129-2306(+)
MRPFGLWPLLFASPAPEISPAGQVVNHFRELYRDLDDANANVQYTPSISFNYVVPPSETDSSSWRCDSQKDVLESRADGADKFFQCVSASHESRKPLALYLPGLDGKGISANLQFDDLAETFEFWRMTVSTDDKTSFTGLVDAVSKFINDAAVMFDRDVVLIGESFGGLLAPAVAIRARSEYFRAHNGEEHLLDPIKGLVLVNPATSFEDTNWSTFAPLLAQLKHLKDDSGQNSNLPFGLPTPYSVVGGLALAASIPDSNQFQRIVSLITDTKVRSVEELTDVLENMVAGFGILDDQLPADIVEHRVGQWLPVGSKVVNPRLSSLNVPTLVIAGQEDNMLPTKKEADRLVNIMPNCTKMEIEGSGHFVLDERVNLTNAIIESNIAPIELPKIDYDPIADWELPSDDIVRETIENRVKPLRNLVSPVFISTGQDGRRRMGLSHLPASEDGKPMLFVANHQFGGLDLGIIISQLIEERSIKARGLAHPIVFQSGNGNPFGGNDGPAQTEQVQDANGDPFSPGLFETFGAVMVTPRNYYRLMQTGQNALLFPGGVREVFHGKDEAHQLFWPEKVDFVRIAAKWNATVVPISAVGAADSVNILIDAPDILKLPFGIGERAANNSANVMSARFDGDEQSELFQPPFALPKPLPARHYFVFGTPMDTEHLDHSDKEGCENFYDNVKSEMMRGFDDILQARENDPWKDTARRIAFEQVTGKIAPTFSVNELH